MRKADFAMELVALVEADVSTGYFVQVTRELDGKKRCACCVLCVQLGIQLGFLGLIINQDFTLSRGNCISTVKVKS